MLSTDLANLADVFAGGGDSFTKLLLPAEQVADIVLVLDRMAQEARALEAVVIPMPARRAATALIGGNVLPFQGRR